MNSNKSKTLPPTPEQIAEFNASTIAQLTYDITKLVVACKIDEPPVIVHALCYVLLQFIMVTDRPDKRLPFSEAGKIAIRILKAIIKHTRYSVGMMDNKVIDLSTNQEISPGGLKQ
jgi:hypothetical protein